MIADLQADSARYRQEQRQSSARGSQSPVMYDVPVEAAGVDGPAYGLSHPPGRIPVPDNRISDRMMLDPPGPPAGRGHHSGNYPGDNRPYLPAERGYPAESRPVTVPGSNGASWMQGSGRGSIPVSQPYPADQSRYPASYAPPDDGVPPGYVRQGGYYVPVGSYAEPSPLSSRSDYVSPPPHAGTFGQPPFGGREPRDGRFAAPPPVSDYPDARYAYPSPPVTVSTVSHRDRDSVTSSPQPSYHATAPPQPAGYTRPYDSRQKYR